MVAVPETQTLSALMEEAKRRARRRRLIGAAAAALVLAIGGGLYLGLSGGAPNPGVGARSSLRAKLPSLSKIDMSAAERLVEFRLAASMSTWIKGDTIAIWRAPQKNGLVCVFTALASPRPSAPGTGGANPMGGGSCGWAAEDRVPPGRLFQIGSTVTYVGGASRWLFSGRVAGDSGIVRLELRSGRGHLPLAYSRGWFLAQLPRSGSLHHKLPPGGPYVLIGYDRNGAEVARVDLARPGKTVTAH